MLRLGSLQRPDPNLLLSQAWTKIALYPRFTHEQNFKSLDIYNMYIGEFCEVSWLLACVLLLSYCIRDVTVHSRASHWLIGSG